MAGDDRKRTVLNALSLMEKQFGRGAVLLLGGTNVLPVSVIPTGSLAIDVALGTGGLPRGRIIEIFGPESSGKTTLTLQVIAEAQKRGGIAAFIDAEHALDPVYARKLGVDLENLLVSQPDSGEQALEIAAALAGTGDVDLIVVDSVAALAPKAELEGEIGDNFIGLQARLMSQALRKLTGLAARTDTCLVFINQLREKVGVMFGNPETTPGGRALKFYSSVRLDVRRTAALKDGDQAVGSRIKVRVVKNKVAPPFREAEADLIHGEGISRESDLVDLGVAHELVERSGAWFLYRGERLGQGRDNARRYLREHAETAARLEAELRNKLGLKCLIDPVKAAPASKGPHMRAAQAV